MDDPKYDLGQDLRLPADEIAAPVERDLCMWGGNPHWAYRMASGGWYFEDSLKDAAQSKPYSKSSIS